MKRFILILLLISTTNPALAQLKTHSFAEAEKLCVQTPKPYAIFIKTSWCKFCKMMENSTFRDETVIELLNDNFYFISFDAEQKEPIHFNGKIFKFIPKGLDAGVHELTSLLTDSSSYPGFVVLEPNYTISLQQTSLIDTKTMILLLQKLKGQQ